MQNVADVKQVKKAEEKVRTVRDRELNDLFTVLKTPEGRRVIWRLLTFCKVFESIWHNSALIHHNSGKQDVGHFILAEVNEADENALQIMMKEFKKENV